MTAAYGYLGWSSTATDTTELNMSAARFAAADTAWIPLPVSFADPPPRPAEPTPERLPKRLRRRVVLHLAESWERTIMARAALVLVTAAALGSALMDAGAM